MDRDTQIVDFSIPGVDPLDAPLLPARTPVPVANVQQAVAAALPAAQPEPVKAAPKPLLITQKVGSAKEKNLRRETLVLNSGEAPNVISRAAYTRTEPAAPRRQVAPTPPAALVRTMVPKSEPASASSSFFSKVGGWLNKAKDAVKSVASSALQAITPSGSTVRRMALAASLLLGVNHVITTNNVSIASDEAPNIEASNPVRTEAPKEEKTLASNKWVEKTAEGKIVSTDFAKAKTAELNVQAKKIANTLDLNALNLQTFDMNNMTVDAKLHKGMGLLQVLASGSSEFDQALKTTPGLRTAVFSHVVDQLASQGLDANVLEIGTQISMEDNTVTLLPVEGGSIQFELIPGLEAPEPEIPEDAPAPEPEPAPIAELEPEAAPAPAPASEPAPATEPVGALDPLDAPLPGKLSPRREVASVKQEIRKTLLDSLGLLDIQPGILIDFAQNEEGGYVGTYTLQLPVRKEAEMGTVNFVHSVKLGDHPYDWEANPKMAAKEAFLIQIQREFVPFMDDVIERHYNPKDLTLDEAPEVLLSRWKLEQSVSSVD